MSLTATDVNKIFNGVQKMIDGAVEQLRLDISHLPTKDEFYEESAKIYSRLSVVEDEDVIKADQIARHDDRINDLEKVHPAGKHTV